MVRKDVALMLYQKSNNRTYFSKILRQRYAADLMSGHIIWKSCEEGVVGETIRWVEKRRRHAIMRKIHRWSEVLKTVVMIIDVLQVKMLHYSD